MKKVIFLNSYSPRTGHNFMAEVVRLASGCEILYHPRAETRLSIILNEIHKVVDPLYFETARDFHNHLFINPLRDQIINYKGIENSYVMIKDTSMRGAEYLKSNFPEDIHILVIRDPRDTLISLFKGMRMKDKNTLKRVLKRIGRFCGIYNYTYSRKFQKRYLKETKVITSEGYDIFRYEDFVAKNEESLKRLLALFNSTQDYLEFAQKVNDIKVLNSSFYKEEGSAQHTWDAQSKSDNFKPVNRKTLRKVERMGIELGCRSLRKQLGYI